MADGPLELLDAADQRLVHHLADLVRVGLRVILAQRGERLGDHVEHADVHQPVEHMWRAEFSGME